MFNCLIHLSDEQEKYDILSSYIDRESREREREKSSGIEILNPFYTVYNSRENLRQDYHGNPRSDIMHEKVLFYTDQEFKLEIILRKTIESRCRTLSLRKSNYKNSKFTFSRLLNSIQRQLCVRE